ncbi:hypothetical protein F2Q68_00027966 [Brassica cretica]|uniref:Endonuclease/exonuclease/phosphatase domain-containing protein n=1 Tax=Brassica cretica TaxID=69181 RepID=A0A8S9IAI2_BRACR|nr:hypothetical protein F2Q68_00027966 [Brassica cretica]
MLYFLGDAEILPSLEPEIPSPAAMETPVALRTPPFMKRPRERHGSSSKRSGSSRIITGASSKKRLMSQARLPYACHGAGGLALLWKADLDIQILTANRNFIDAIIPFKDSTFHGTFIYGAPDICNHQEVWNQLIDLSLTRHSPWFLTGDFNDIICNDEKSGGTGPPAATPRKGHREWGIYARLVGFLDQP